MLSHVKWLGHSGIQITGSRVVYVDPYHIGSTETADLILITHAHYDHFSPEDIQKISGDDTILIASFDASTGSYPNFRRVAAGDQIELNGVEIKAVPSYNIGKAYHPRHQGNVGYVFKVDGITYYHAGDTDYIPEMTSIRADVVFLPVSGTFTMTAHEAVQAAEAIQPRVAVPIHWGSVAGSRDDADLFVQLCSCCEAKILPHL